MRSRLRLSLVTAVAAVTVTACAATPPPPPPPPMGPSGQPGRVLRDWRSIITSTDRDRYTRRDAAWALALQQARRLPGSGDLSGSGDASTPTPPAPACARPSATIAAAPSNWAPRAARPGSAMSSMTGSPAASRRRRPA